MAIASSTDVGRRGPFHHAWERLRRTDWRVWAVLTAVLVSVIVTGAAYYYGLGLDPATHFAAVFASWVGGVALFIIAGVVVAIVSLARPEEGSFDARARILFRRQTGKHIDYIVSRISSILEQYAVSQVLTVTIEKYHDLSNTFLITIYNETVLRSYIDDISSTYTSQLDYQEVTIPPPGEASNVLAFVRVKGKPLGTREEFSNSISREIKAVVDPHNFSKAEFQISFWVRANTESNTQTCVRYTQLFRLDVENLLTKPVKIEIKNPQGRWDQKTVNEGETKMVYELEDLSPDVVAVEYRIMDA